MVDRARNAPVLLPRVPRPTRPRCWMALRPGLLRRGAVPRRKPWRGSPAQTGAAPDGFACSDSALGRRAAAGAAAGSGAQAERAARAARNRGALPDALRVLGRMGLPFLLSSLAGTRAGLAGASSVGPARRRLTASCLRRRASWAYAARRRGAWRDVRLQGGQCGGLDVARQLAEQDQRLAQVVYRGAGQLVADFRQHGLARLAIVTAGADLDQAMGSQRPVDF